MLKYKDTRPKIPVSFMISTIFASKLNISGVERASTEVNESENWSMQNLAWLYFYNGVAISKPNFQILIKKHHKFK